MKRIINKIRSIIHFVSLYGQHLPLAFSALFSFRCAVLKIRGRIKKSDKYVEIVYVGRKQNLEYLKRQLLDSPEIIDQIDSTLLTFRTHARRVYANSDVMVVDIGWPYHYCFNTKNEYIEIPDWVNMLVDTEGELSDVVAKFRKTARAYDMRMIRKYDYTYDLVNDDAAIDYFYEKMYTPFVHGTHGESAIVADRKAILKRVKQGKLLRVHYQGNVLAAGVIYPENDILYFLWMGSLPELPLGLTTPVSNKKLPEGVISALYYFGIEYACKIGMDAVDFTGTRSLLSDGTFHFKRKWGAIVEDTFSPSSVLIKLKENSALAVEFAMSAPIIIRTAVGLEIRFVVKDVRDQNENKVIERLWKQHGCEGIASLTVFNVDDTQSEVIRNFEYEGKTCCWIQCKQVSFSQQYGKDYSDRNVS
ncbi:hypothetical protein [Aurantivibrio infirmus]